MTTERPVVPVALLVVVTVLAVLLVPRFSTPLNFTFLVRQAVPLELAAVGQTLVLIAGGIDLSLGEVITLTNLIASFLLRPGPFGWVAGVGIALAAAALVGLLNATAIVRLRLPPFLVTVATMFALQGLNLYLRPVPGGAVPAEFRVIAFSRIGVLPVASLVVLVGVALLAVHLRRSRFGLHLRAVGGQEEYARLAGVSPSRVKYWTYTLASLSAALAGLFLAARTGSGDPLIGRPYSFDSITAAVVGGASLFGGVGSVWGTFASALVLAMLSNILNLLRVVPYWQWVIKGAILVTAVAAYAVGEAQRRARSETALRRNQRSAAGDGAQRGAGGRSPGAHRDRVVPAVPDHPGHGAPRPE